MSPALLIAWVLLVVITVAGVALGWWLIRDSADLPTRERAPAGLPAEPDPDQEQWSSRQRAHLENLRRATLRALYAQIDPATMWMLDQTDHINYVIKIEAQITAEMFDGQRRRL